MTLRLYNTLSRKKEDFAPFDPGHVRIYVCGPTVYDYAHIGNARPVVVFDVLYRLLKTLYPRVTYARNITDVDDKIIAAAQETGEAIEAITARFADAFHADMAALGALDPDIEPRATQHIPQMIAMVQRLIEAGHAYAEDGHVLFNVPSMPDYGKLSRHNRDELIAGARVEVAPYKKDAADFVLWKPSDPDQPGWDSPWGRGRPGWHLECSAMSETHLGESFDIHGGGQDLIFPHHENEIAQSTCSHHGAPFVRYWMHNGYVTVDGEKMSKSLGNFYTVRQLLDEGWDGETIRLALLSAHYRQPLDFSRKGLEEAKKQLDRLYTALRNANDVEISEEVDTFVARSALEDDLNTPGAIANLHGLATKLNREVEMNEDDCLWTKAALIGGAGLLGLLQHDPEDWFKGKRKVVGVVSGTETDTAGSATREKRPSEPQITEMISLRAKARKDRNFEEADRIRDELASEGIILEDRPDGTTDWRRT